MLSLTLALLFIAYHLELHRIIPDIYSKFSRFKNTNFNSLLLNMAFSSVIFAYTLKAKILQILNGNVRKIAKNRYMLNYIIEGKLYTTIIPVKKGPSDILQILDKNSNDVTIDIYPYSGSDESFKHSISLSPVALGYEELTINLSDGRAVKIQGEEPLSSYLLN